MTSNEASEWAPAPGAVARHAWPLAARVAWWLLHRPALVTVLGLCGVLGWLAGPVGLAVIVATTALGLTVWHRVHPASFEPTAGRVLLGIWRSGWAYGARWRAAMMLSGLGGRFDGDEYLPRVVRVRAGRWADRVVVRMVAGQQPADWAKRSEALAHAFGARSCRVTALAGRPGYAVLQVGRADPLAEVVPALPIPDTAAAVDMTDVPVGVREDGEPWTLRLGGSHVLVGGAVGAGKSSVIWSLVRALAPAVRDGLVQLWVCDPKGGMELAAGAPLFTRFAWTPAAMVELLEDAAALMEARCDRLRGVTRVHTPTVEEPAVVVIVDEVARLTAYEPDNALRKRTHQAMATMLTLGRAPAVSVLAALQDPRKEVIPLRDLFPTRVSLRTTEREQVGFVLGATAHERGAVCERIPRAMPGVGYVLLDGDQDPTRVRAAWVDDDDIAHLADAYRPGAAPATSPAVEDLADVVIDLTDRAATRP
jgi:S-DNA-T family DNA segregation ATPase FtsK/SpoIIIE